MMTEKFVPAYLSEAKVSPKEAKAKAQMMVEQEFPILEVTLRKIRFNTGYQAGYVVGESGDILFYVSEKVDLDYFKDVVEDLKKVGDDLSRRLKVFLRQGGKVPHPASAAKIAQVCKEFQTF